MMNNINTETTKRTVEAYMNQYKLIGNKDTSVMLGLLSDDIDWDIPGDTSLAPWVGKRKGKKGVETFFQLFGQYVAPQQITIDNILADGAQAAVFGSFASRMLKTGKVYKSDFSAHLVVENGKITKYVFSEDTQGLVDTLTEGKDGIDLIKQYFTKSDGKVADIDTLFSEDCELFYPKFGERVGRREISKFVLGFRDLASLSHEIEDFTYHVAGDTVTVEGTESGVLKNGKTFSKSLFCSVFTIKNNLISRMYVYVDPDFGGEDKERFRWKV